MTSFSLAATKPLISAFPLCHMRIAPDLELRPLQDSDIDELCGILCDDPEMTWTRRAWTRENVEYLLNLRLKHYEDHGFGAYAVLYNNKLIGMAGAQVWEYNDDSIELLSYISRKYWNLGITSQLMNWLIDTIQRQTNLHSVYAATRHENKAAISLTEKFGFKRIGEENHFGFPSIHWKLDLAKKV